MSDIINIKDANGRWVCLKKADVSEMLEENDIYTKLFGMTAKHIIYLRTQYQLRGGTYPATLEKITAAFKTRTTNQSFQLDGLTMDNIVDLHTQYQLRNGKMPMTTESIEEAFGPPIIKRDLKILKRFQKAFNSSITTHCMIIILIQLIIPKINEALKGTGYSYRIHGDEVHIMCNEIDLDS